MRWPSKDPDDYRGGGALSGLKLDDQEPMPARWRVASFFAGVATAGAASAADWPHDGDLLAALVFFPAFVMTGADLGWTFTHAWRRRRRAAPTPTRS